MPKGRQQTALLPALRFVSLFELNHTKRSRQVIGRTGREKQLVGGPVVRRARAAKETLAFPSRLLDALTGLR